MCDKNLNLGNRGLPRDGIFSDNKKRNLFFLKNFPMTLQQHVKGVWKKILMDFRSKIFFLPKCFQSIFCEKIIFLSKKNFGGAGAHVFRVRGGRLNRDSFKRIFAKANYWMHSKLCLPCTESILRVLEARDIAPEYFPLGNIWIASDSFAADC